MENEELKEECKVSLIALIMIMFGLGMFISGIISAIVTGNEPLTVSVGAIFFVGGILYNKLDEIQCQIRND